MDYGAYIKLLIVFYTPTKTKMYVLYIRLYFNYLPCFMFFETFTYILEKGSYIS